MKFLYTVLILLMLPLGAAATITGTTYDFSLKPAATTLEINSTPAQTYVAGDGKYSLEVSPGVYVVSVSEVNSHGLELREEQQIVISDEGSYVLDFIIFPGLDEVDEPELELVESESDSGISLTLPLIILVSIFLALLVFLMRSHQKKDELADDELEKRVLAIIKAHRRMKQKDLRKRLPESESAVSLVITDLEKKGRVEKIKKGRANILVFKK